MVNANMFLQLLMILTLLIHPGNSSKSPLAPALYIFGDSLVDSGNNNFLLTVAKANFLPYGLNFETGPTGRFTNGKTVADFIAEFLELPYPPAYLSLQGGELNQLTGLNFASGSCGILPETGNILGKCLNMAEQVNLFSKVVEGELPNYFLNSGELSCYLSKSVFLISIGSNDYIINYLGSHYDSSQRYSPQSFAQLLIGQLSQQLQRLYQLGARKVVTFELGPIGCTPYFTKQFVHKGPCVEDINQLVTYFNSYLADMLQSLTSELEGSTFILGRVNRIGYDAAINPSKYGLDDSSNPCCSSLNGNTGCIPGLQALACPYPNGHYFFDGFHLTQNLYRTIALYCFSGSSICIPKNIKQLL